MNEDAVGWVSGNDFGNSICDKGSGMFLVLPRHCRYRVNVDRAAFDGESGGDVNPGPSRRQVILQEGHRPRDSMRTRKEMVVADIRSQREQCLQR